MGDKTAEDQAAAAIPRGGHHLRPMPGKNPWKTLILLLIRLKNMKNMLAKAWRPKQKAQEDHIIRMRRCI